MIARRGCAALLLLLWGAPSAAQETSDYVISHYELTVFLEENSPSARIVMDVTYRIMSGTKSEGFKYVGDNVVSDAAGEDADRRPLRVTTQQQRELMIRWRFPPAGRGETRMRIRFTIPLALSGGPTESVFDAPWAGIFKVPVERAVYRLVLPEGWTEQALSVRPRAMTPSTYLGRRAVEVVQAPLSDTRFRVALRPGLTQAAVQPSRRRSSSMPWMGALVVLAFLGFVVMAAARAKRGTRGWGSSTSSCGGGGGCSSGCGGGGCGGGCGG